MPFCEKPSENCPVYQNLQALLDGKPNPDTTDENSLLNDISIGEIRDLAMGIICDGHCEGPERYVDEADKSGKPKLITLANMDEVISQALAGTVFCGIDTFDEFEDRIEVPYGVYLTSSETEE